MQEEFTITVRALDGPETPVVVTSTTTVRQMRDLYAQQRDWPSSNCVMVFDGKYIDEDPDEPLAEFNIGPGAVLHARINMDGQHQTDPQLLKYWHYVKIAHPTVRTVLHKSRPRQVQKLTLIDEAGPICDLLVTLDGSAPLTVAGLEPRAYEVGVRLIDAEIERRQLQRCLTELTSLRAAAEPVFGAEDTVRRLLDHLHAMPGSPLAEAARQHFHQ